MIKILNLHYSPKVNRIHPRIQIIINNIFIMITFEIKKMLDIKNIYSVYMTKKL